MRKVILPSVEAATPVSGQWLDLDEVAVAEVSSEDPQHQFERALSESIEGGWRAAGPGPQVIRLKFDTPQSIRRVRLKFREDTLERSQEFAVFATSTSGTRKEILRQQWTFSPGGSTTEIEDLSLDLSGVSVLELEIDPGRHDKQVVASLDFLGIA